MGIQPEGQRSVEVGSSKNLMITDAALKELLWDFWVLGLRKFIN